MTSDVFKLDIWRYRDNKAEEAMEKIENVKKFKKTKKLRVMSEWSWDLGQVAFGKKCE